MQELLTPQEVAKILKVHLRTVYVYLRSGQLPAAKIGDTWRIRPEDLQQFIEQRMARNKGEEGSAAK